MTDERVAAEGLNIRGFLGKWNHAKEYELDNKRTDDTRLLPYWERVSLSFLAFCGEYIGQKYGDKR